MTNKIGLNFNNFILHPSKCSTSKGGKVLAVGLSILTGIFTLGMLHASLAIKQKRIKKMTTEQGAKVGGASQSVLASNRRALVNKYEQFEFKSSKATDRDYHPPVFEAVQNTKGAPQGHYRLKENSLIKSHFVLEIAGVKETLLLKEDSEKTGKYKIVRMKKDGFPTECPVPMALPQIISLALWKSNLPEGWRLSNLDFGYPEIAAFKDPENNYYFPDEKGVMLLRTQKEMVALALAMHSLGS